MQPWFSYCKGNRAVTSRLEKFSISFRVAIIHTHTFKIIFLIDMYAHPQATIFERLSSFQ